MKAKKLCYPPSSEITVTASMIAIKLQSIIDLSVRRLISTKNFFVSLGDKHLELTLLSKWGIDGCGSLNKYKQKSNEENIHDSSVLVTSFVPLQLYSVTSESSSQKLIW